jgi:hypothetical protein
MDKLIIQKLIYRRYHRVSTKPLNVMADEELEELLFKDKVKFKKCILEEILRRYKESILKEKNDMCYWDWS